MVAATDKTSVNADAPPDETANLPFEQRLRGAWVSEVRESKAGAMRFEFRFSADGDFEVDGVPVEGSAAEPYHRSAPFRLEKRTLVSAAINEGQPVQLSFDHDKLILVIDDSLNFRLSRGSLRPATGE